MAKKPYLYKKKASTSRERALPLRERPGFVEVLAVQVQQGRISEEQAADALNVSNIEEFREYCAEWLSY